MLGCHPALAGILSPPVIVPTPSPAGVYLAVAEAEVPGRVAWFQHQLLKVMACKDSLYGRGLPNPQGDLHFCLSIRPLGPLPAQQNLAWSTAGGWGRNPESDQGSTLSISTAHRHVNQNPVVLFKCRRTCFPKGSELQVPLVSLSLSHNLHVTRLQVSIKLFLQCLHHRAYWEANQNKHLFHKPPNKKQNNN